MNYGSLSNQQNQLKKCFTKKKLNFKKIVYSIIF